MPSLLLCVGSTAGEAAIASLSVDIVTFHATQLLGGNSTTNTATVHIANGTQTLVQPIPPLTAFMPLQDLSGSPFDASVPLTVTWT